MGCEREERINTTGKKEVLTMEMGKNEVNPCGEKIKSSVSEMLSLRCLIHVCISWFFFPLCNKLPEV